MHTATLTSPGGRRTARRCPGRAGPRPALAGRPTSVAGQLAHVRRWPGPADPRRVHYLEGDRL